MNPRPRPGIMDIAAYVGGASKLSGQNRVTKLSSNEGAFGTPAGAQAALVQAAKDAFRYPDGSAAELRRALGARFGLDPQRIVCGAGSDELIYLLVLSYGGPGTELLTTEYAFSIYEIAGRFAGCRVVKARERGLTAEVDSLLAAVSPATRLVFLANPNNPTGTLVPQAELERLRAGLPPEVLLVLDAAYAEYVDVPGYDPGVRLVDAGENTVMTRTFSKIFGLGGARVGWCYAPASVADVLNRVRGPFNVNAAAQAAAVAALAEPGWVEFGRKHNTEYRAWLSAELGKLGIPVPPSACNFVLADFGSPARAATADAALKARGVIVRGLGGYGLGRYLRITIGTAEECALVVEALAAFVAEAAETAHA